MSANVLLLAKLLTMIVSSVEDNGRDGGAGKLASILRLVEFGSSFLGLSPGGGDCGRAIHLIVRELIRVTDLAFGEDRVW
jgi:hypothetical protein